MRILITGASGYVGAKVLQELKNQGHDVWGTYRSNQIGENGFEVDLTNQSEVRDVLEKLKPDIIVHLAAIAHSKVCEEDPELAQKVNVDATSYLVDFAKSNGTKFIYLSSFACFNISNVYGQTKYEAEQLVESLEKYVILRASLIVGFSPNFENKNFFNTLLKDVQDGNSIEADTSWEIEVTYLNHLSRVISEVIATEDINKVMLPVVAKGVISRWKLASDLLAQSGVEVTPIDQNRVIPLPSFDTEILEKRGLPEITYEECIREMRDEVDKFIS